MYQTLLNSKDPPANSIVEEILYYINPENLNDKDYKKTLYSSNKVTNSGKILDYKGLLTDKECKYIEENYSDFIYTEETK